MGLGDEQLLRYSRQIMLPQIDVAGQQRIVDATVLIVGMGGLGCPAALYLAAAGVGRLIIADDDQVELTNLQRQVAHAVSSIGQPKVASAATSLTGINPDIELIGLQQRLAGRALDEQVKQADVVVDATDNFATRFDINRSCITLQKPLVSGAAIRCEGQLAVFDTRLGHSPCYQCLYDPAGDDDTSCATNGILAPVVGAIGSLQAVETLKLISGAGEPLIGRLLIFDALAMQWREMKLARDPECEACCNRPGTAA